MNLDPRDRLLQAHTPAVMVPRFGQLDPLAITGHRYLVAFDGIWLEVRRPWLWLRALMAASIEHPMPFGQVLGEADAGREYCAVYAWSADDLAHVQSLFLYDARKACPNEFAAWAVWNTRTNRLEYRPLIATAATPVSIDLVRPRLEEHEHLAIDMHSHGQLPAGFSSTDDEDDAGEVKLSVVAGTLAAEPTWSTRLCAHGLFLRDVAEDLDV